MDVIPAGIKIRRENYLDDHRKLDGRLVLMPLPRNTQRLSKRDCDKETLFTISSMSTFSTSLNRKRQLGQNLWTLADSCNGHVFTRCKHDRLLGCKRSVRTGTGLKTVTRYG